MHLESAVYLEEHNAVYHQHNSPLCPAAVKVLSPTAEVRGPTAIATGPNTAISISSTTALPAICNSGQGSHLHYCSDPSTKYNSSWGCTTGLAQKDASRAGCGVLGAAHHSLPYGLAAHSRTTGLHSIRSSMDSFTAALLDDAIDGAVVSQLLPQRATNGIWGLCIGKGSPGHLGGYSEPWNLSAHKPAFGRPAAGQGMAACPVAAKDDLSATVRRMLMGLPSEQQRLFTQALAASSNPQQLLSAMQAGSADAGVSSALLVSPPQLNNSTCASAESSQPALQRSGVANSSGPNGTQSLQLLQLQAALIAQQQALAPVCSAWAPGLLSPAGQDLVQLLAAQQQALSHQSSKSTLANFTTMSNSMPFEGGRLPQYHQALSSSAAATAPTNAWSFSSLSAPSAIHASLATATAMMQHQQQQQQQAHLEPMKQSPMSSPAAAATSYDQQALSAQLAVASAAAAAATCGTSAGGKLGPVCRAPDAGTRRLSTHGLILGSCTHSACPSHGAVPATSPGAGQTSFPGLSGCRSRSGGPRRSTSDSILQHSSAGGSYSRGLHEPGALDSASAVEAAGVCISALSPATFTEHWGTDETPRDTASVRDRPSLPVNSPSRISSSGSETCSHRSSTATLGSPLASGRLSSADGEVFLMDLGLHSRDSVSSSNCSPMFEADSLTAGASKCVGMEQKLAILDKASSVNSLLGSKATALRLQEQDPGSITLTPAADIQPTLSCPVWYPSARESSGDDSWHLELPPTCRLFVGNIGCWVDEAMLLSYFGKYGNVVDVQVRTLVRSQHCY